MCNSELIRNKNNVFKYEHLPTDNHCDSALYHPGLVQYMQALYNTYNIPSPYLDLYISTPYR